MIIQEAIDIINNYHSEDADGDSNMKNEEDLGQVMNQNNPEKAKAEL